MEVETIGCLTKFILIMPSNTTYERDGQIRTIIGLDVITQEINEVLDNNGSDTSIIKMVTDKLRERG